MSVLPFIGVIDERRLPMKNGQALADYHFFVKKQKPPHHDIVHSPFDGQRLPNRKQ